jgi:long-chain acyl-CoA synthetase
MRFRFSCFCIARNDAFEGAKPDERSERDNVNPPLFLGIISGQRKRTHAEVADRAARIAGGLQKLGVKSGDSVCILMRNDIAFIEAVYAVMAAPMRCR